jgi:heme oxygenase
VSIDNLAQPATAFDDVAQALGCLYVVHRNTLYHGLVLRHLKTLIPEEIQTAGSYLSAFEGLAGARMRELGDVLDRVARRGDVAGRIVGGANDAFRCQQQWYSRSAREKQATNAASDRDVSEPSSMLGAVLR